MNEQGLKERLQFISKEKGIHFNECWKKLLLERFLSRLSRSKHSQKFIFKGGFLLSYMMDIGRETTDLDFLLISMNANEDEIKQAIKEIIAIELEDGFLFSYEKLELLEQPHMDYPGYRVSLKATFGRMKDKIYIDVGIGDVVIPLKPLKKLWIAHLKALGKSVHELQLPENIQDVILEINKMVQNIVFIERMKILFQ